jgi:hypothetical protein
MAGRAEPEGIQLRHLRRASPDDREQRPVPLDQFVALLDDPAQLLGDVSGLVPGQGGPQVMTQEEAQFPAGPAIWRAR